MTKSDQLLIDQREGVLTLTLNRPDALNALTPEMLTALADALEAGASDVNIRVVVITGNGRAFSAGVDLKSLNGAPIVDGMVGDLLDSPGRRAIDAMESMAKPVVAKVNGHCFTGALELVLGCDLVYVAEGAKFGDTHAKWGLRPTWGMSQRLPRKVGVTRARELSLTAMTFGAADALAWGLANDIAPREELDERVSVAIAAIIENSGDAIAAYKDLWYNTFDATLAEGLAYEAATNYPIPDSAERLAAFLK